VVAYECLAGHPPFTASEPLAIAFAHKHEPVPALPPDLPQPVSDLVYHMLAKTPAERPASVQVIADRADMLRRRLAMSESAEPGYSGATRTDLASATRGDLPAAATGVLLGADDPATGLPSGPRGPRGLRRSRRRRQLMAAGSTAALCAAAAAAGLYLTGHISGQGSGKADANTAQHLSSPAATQTHQVRQSPRHTPTPTPSLAVNPPAPSPSGNPKPAKSSKPSSVPRSSPPNSPSASSSSSATGTGSPSVTPPSSSPPSTP